jgi:hypothetical protein
MLTSSTDFARKPQFWQLQNLEYLPALCHSQHDLHNLSDEWLLPQYHTVRPRYESKFLNLIAHGLGAIDILKLLAMDDNQFAWLDKSVQSVS